MRSGLTPRGRGRDNRIMGDPLDFYLDEGGWPYPDEDVDEDQKTRWSAVYEYTPIPFVQLRAGFRRHDGIPQNDFDNRDVAFVEVHGFF